MNNKYNKNDIDIISEAYVGGPNDIPDSIHDAVGGVFNSGNEQQVTSFVDSLNEGSPVRDMIIAMLDNFDKEEDAEQWLDKFLYVADNVIEDGDWWTDKDEEIDDYSDDE